ncbi:MAG: hypothetical protein JJU20_06150 [Opitutales bacterium]|nr:hypothetical protein [Opitutales bacterium]
MKFPRLTAGLLCLLCIQPFTHLRLGADSAADASLPLEGASVYFYTDLEGDFERMGEFGNRIYREFILQQEGMPPFPVDISKLYERLGLTNIKGMSAASYPLENGYFNNASILHLIEDGPKGIWGIFDLTDRPFEAAEAYSAKSDLVVQLQLNPRNLLLLTEALAGDLMGGFGQMMIQQQLEMQLSEDGLTVRDLVLAFDQPISLAIYLPPASLAYDPAQDSFVDAPVEVAFAARFPGAGEKLRSAIAYAEQFGARVYEVDAITWVDLQMDLEGGLTPLFGVDADSGDLIITSAAEDWVWFREGTKLIDDPGYQKLRSQLPEQAAMFSYTSTMLGQTQASDLMDQAALPHPLLEEFEQALAPYLRPTVSTTRKVDGGIRTDNIHPYSYKHQVWLIGFLILKAAMEQNLLSADDAMDYSY